MTSSRSCDDASKLNSAPSVDCSSDEVGCSVIFTPSTSCCDIAAAAAAADDDDDDDVVVNRAAGLLRGTS